LSVTTELLILEFWVSEGKTIKNKKDRTRYKLATAHQNIKTKRKQSLKELQDSSGILEVSIWFES
jgi:hypothetical protein